MVCTPAPAVSEDQVAGGCRSQHTSRATSKASGQDVRRPRPLSPMVSVDVKHHVYLYQPAKTGRVVELESSHKVVEIRLRMRVCGKQRVASYNLTVKTYPPSTLPATCYLSKCRGKGRTPRRPLRRSLTSGWRLGTERRPSAGNNATRSRPTSRQDTDFGQLPALIKPAMESLSDTAEHTPSVKYLSRTRRPLKLAYTESVAQGKQAIRRPLFSRCFKAGVDSGRTTTLQPS